jgi:hypothetical protein
MRVDNALNAKTLEDNTVIRIAVSKQAQPERAASAWF